MIRKYGRSPYNIAVLHGGPGAVGSAACLAGGLAKYCGVIEPLQSKHTIKDLLLELDGQLAADACWPVILAGHSWGAWLAALYAMEFPAKVKRLVLIGCPPFVEEYAPEIEARRMANLSIKEQTLFKEAITALSKAGADDKDYFSAVLSELCFKSDNYCLLPEDEYDALCSFDSDMYASIWGEAAALRRSGALKAALGGIKCPVCIIHGVKDPHPFEGVFEPLALAGVSFEKHLLENCGHTPFKEKFAVSAFYEILEKQLKL